MNIDKVVDNTDSNKDDNQIAVLTKYSIVFRFWSTLQEIAVTNLVSCQNKFTKEFVYKFFDSEGRLWDNVPENDVIIIKNSPDKEDIDDFMRLKRETEQLNKLLSSKKPEIEDVSIR